MANWFLSPPRVYFGPGSLASLERLGGTRAFVVTDKMMVQLGYAEKAVRHLARQGMQTEVFDGVEPDPSVETVQAGAEAMRRFGPDLIVALGGGSPMDAAKGMWLLYEQPGATFESLKAAFSDISRRAFQYPVPARKATFVAVPTTSGSGSEVTAFAVVTDKARDIKYPLADFELLPDVAILDPELVMSLPRSVTADTGIDVLTHALEAFVSPLASDYTDALAIRAIELVFRYLPAAYAGGGDREAREKMHNASALAGLAFTNALLGINHSLAHVLGARFHIPHGRANGILLPHVIAYNAGGGGAPNPYRAAGRYAEIAHYLRLTATCAPEGVTSLMQAVRELMQKVELPLTVASCGVQREPFMAAVPGMAAAAMADPCTGTNPRRPAAGELEAIYRAAYGV